MIDQDFLKTLTILYVEDDSSINRAVSDILEKLFGRVILVEDGLRALEIFKQSLDVHSEHPIDVILSDLKLPKLNGLDLLEEVHRVDPSVPFIFSTAHLQSEDLLQAIKLGACEFFVKPIQIREIVLHIQSVCEMKHQENRILHYQKELKKYVEVIDQVAIVSKFDGDRKYKFVNDFFCEVTGYQEEMILGQDISTIYPDDVASSLYNEKWKQLESGETYRGKLRYKTKENADYFVTTTIFPIKVEETEGHVEYIAIDFLTTQDENEKRQFKKKVMYNLKETRRINTVARKKIDDLQAEVQVLQSRMEEYKHFDVLEDKFKMEKTRNKKLLNQINYYEYELEKEKKRTEEELSKINERLNRMEIIRELKKKHSLSVEENRDLRAQLDTMEDKHNRLNELLDERLKKISDLEDVVNNL